MIKIENRFFFILAFLMASVVALSNYLVQFPVNYLGLKDLLTYGAFSYPIAFLITDLSNRRYGKNTAKKIVYLGFALGVFLTLYFSTNYSDLISIRIAIGSGGIWGKGVGEGTQTQLRYLPVRDTDFIVSVIGEEMGLLGITVILVVFFTMLYWIIVYAGIISNRFSSLTLIGFASILFIHLAVNMGMTVGLLPVTGLPAPFLSYGGSFLLSCMLILALSTNIINHHI